MMVAGFMPVVLLGLRDAGGWAALKASVPGVILPGATHPVNPLLMGATGLFMGVVLSAIFWGSDFRVIQISMAAKNMDSARTAPLIAAVLRLFFPLVLIVPGLLAMGMPTPHSSTVSRTENGAIIHEITVVSHEVEAGKGLVPAEVDSSTGKPRIGVGGAPLLNYELAAPNLLLHYLPAGLLGLGLAAFLASLMSGLAASVTAFNAVFAIDIYQSWMRRGSTDSEILAIGRWATAAAVLLAVGIAYAVRPMHHLLSTSLLAFSLVDCPLFAILLLGMFWKRATAHGAFAGLLAGIGAAVVHHGLTLPAEAHPGMQGGWIAVLHVYSSPIVQVFWTAALGLAAGALVTVGVSLLTAAKAELTDLVYSRTSNHSDTRAAWMRRPSTLAIALLVTAVVLSLLFL